MGARDPAVLVVPEEKDDEIVVSKKGLAELKRQAEERTGEIERLRKENAELRRRLQVHENPNVPPSVRHHAPGYARDRPLVPPNERKRPGGRPGHAGITREPLTPDREIALTADTCGKCRGHRRKFRGEETEQEVEEVRQRVVIDYAVAVYDCLECGETVQARLPSGRGKELYHALGVIYTRLTRNLEHASPRARARRAAWGERQIAELVKGYGKSWARGVRKGVTYLENGRAWWLTFLRHPGVEATNNRAERSIREAVVIRKIVGTLRNSKGAEALTRLLSVLGTWKLRGESPSANLYAILSRPGPLSGLNTYAG